VFDIQKFSIHDGPGLRTLVFFKGCPLSCPWCSNPEGVRPGFDVVFLGDRCVACGRCVDVCPAGVHQVREVRGTRRHRVASRDRCTGCGRCAAACVHDALRIAGRDMTVEEANRSPFACVKTGDPTTFATFAEFEAAVKRQIDHITKVCAELTVIAMRAQRKFLPKPLMSSLVEGCVDSGRDVMDGGALCNCGPGLVWVGVANYANSLAAVKRLVYDERRFTIAELVAALDADFAGFEDVRHACLGAPKYGNDDDYADLFAGDALEYAARLGESYTFANGGRMSVGTLSVSSNTPYGLVIGALPDGRRAGAPLSDGISPAQGTDRLGPTAVIRSVTKYPHDLMSIGVLHNMKLDPGIVSTPDGRQALISLIRTHGVLGGAQLQFNCTTQEKLLAAQRDPDEYRGMVVRVAGYSAFFVELSREVQDEIISRPRRRAGLPPARRGGWTLRRKSRRSYRAAGAVVGGIWPLAPLMRSVSRNADVRRRPHTGYHRGSTEKARAVDCGRHRSRQDLRRYLQPTALAY
jgi:ferredoxin